jgi:hypothetical protein
MYISCFPHLDDPSWSRVVTFTLLPLYSRGKSSLYSLCRRLVGPQSRSRLYGGVKNSWPHRDSNSDPLIIQPVASSSSDYVTAALVTSVERERERERESSFTFCGVDPTQSRLTDRRILHAEVARKPCIKFPFIDLFTGGCKYQLRSGVSHSGVVYAWLGLRVLNTLFFLIILH